MPSEAILVVDDNFVNLQLARVTLAAAGYDVRTAESAAEALAEIERHQPRLILMDIQMPGMDGLELTRQLKADPATQSIVVVAVTSYAMKGDDQKVLAAGCDGYIPKPLNTRTLADQVAAYVREAR
ncbi:MAG: response regulator [Chloroflexi bacterium]|nr:response regulator [Chloroflexota bacterium]